MNKRRTTKIKRRLLRLERDSRKNFLTFILSECKGSKYFTQQFWDSKNQWGDFYFIHPNRRIVVTVYVRTLAMAYHDICEKQATAFIDSTSDMYWLDETFSSRMVPLYKTTKNSNRPRIYAYKISPLSEKSAKDSQDYYGKVKRKIEEIEDSSSVFVSEKVEVERNLNGLFVSVIIDKPELLEKDFDDIKELALGFRMPSTVKKTYSSKEITSLFRG